MDENLVSWSIENIITINVMVAVVLGIFFFISSVIKSHSSTVS